MPQVFPPLTTGFSFTDSSTAFDGSALPAGEAAQSTTIGIRLDGDTTHQLGNYAFLVIVPVPASSESLSALTAALGKALPAGNYWANAQQTDVVAATGQTATSDWMTTEVPFSIPPQAVRPAAPTALAVS